MAMLRQLAVTDFRSDPDVQLSFPLWAEGLPTIPAVPPHAPHDASLSEPEAQDEAKEPSAETSRAPSAPKVEDLCSFLDSASDADMAKAVASVEEALQAKDTAGAFVIQKQNGRPRLQNKLKRTKARLADLLAKSAEPSTQPQQRQAHPPEISQEEREDYLKIRGQKEAYVVLAPQTRTAITEFQSCPAGRQVCRTAGVRAGVSSTLSSPTLEACHAHQSLGAPTSTQLRFAPWL